jgi:hypothetical protein
MPKLNQTHIVERLQKRIEQLEKGEKLDARDINALLAPEQQKQLADGWAEQQSIRKQHRSQASAELAGLVWKTKTEVRLDIYRQALAEALDSLPNALEDQLHQQEVRGARIALEAYFSARTADKNGWTAANNALRRAGLNRMDGITQAVGTKRDKEVWAMEEVLRSKIEFEMTDDEREQHELLAEYERSVGKKQGRV